MYGHLSNIFCEKKKKKSGIHKNKLTINIFIILGYVNNYGKKHYL